MSGATSRPKYLDALEAELRSMAARLDKRRTWLVINCGVVGEGMVGIDAAASSLCSAAAAMDKEVHRRRHAKVEPFPAKAAR